MISFNLKKRIYTSIFLLFILVIIWFSKLTLVFSLIIIEVLSILEFLSLIHKIKINIFNKFLTNFLFILYISLFNFTFFFFSNFLQLKMILFSILFGCIASDIGGYLFGKLFGGPKLSKFSPKKTISGSLGSIFSASIIMLITIFYFTNNLNYKFIIIGIITSIFCQFGDLFFSFLKRKAKIKDTGNFLPGHGGILDRVDGMLLGIPFGFLSMMFIY